MANNDDPRNPSENITGRSYLKLALDNAIEDKQASADLHAALQKEFGGAITERDLRTKVTEAVLSLLGRVWAWVAAAALIGIGVAIKHFFFS